MADQNKIFASDLKFKPSVSQMGDLSIVTNREAINQAIYNIIKTPRGARVMNPLFGAGIESFLFEPLTEDVAQGIGKTIVSQILLWEPRIEILSTQVNVFESPSPGYEISIRYMIKQTFTEGNFEMFLNKLI
jgi:phage baseplate assembly protein W